jgi:hypothetical protein
MIDDRQLLRCAKKTDIHKRGDNLFVIFNAVQNRCLGKGEKGKEQLFTAQKTSAFCAHL